MRKARITVIGGAHVDRRGHIQAETKPGASNPGSWFEEAGGGGFNAARNLSLLGHDVTMFTTCGGDANAANVAAAAERTGITLSGFTFLDRATPTYTAILERDGNLVIALADMALYELFTPKRLSVNWLRDKLRNCDLIVCDANLPAATLRTLSSEARANNIPLAAIGVSPAKVVRLKDSLENLTWLFMNEAEAKALSGELPDAPSKWPGIMRKIGLKGGMITRGMKPAIGWSNDTAASLAPPAIETIGDVTGAGDSFAAGALHAFISGGPLTESMRYGAALARLTVASNLAVAEDLSLTAVENTLSLVPQPQLLERST